MTRIHRIGPRGERWGFKFQFRGREYKRWIGTKAQAAMAERRFRHRLDTQAFQTTWGPQAPVETSWDEALKRYRAAKLGKRSLDLDLVRLHWWRSYLTGQGMGTLQAVSPEALDQAKHALATQQRSPQTIVHYLSVLRHLYQLAVRRWRVVAANPVHAVDFPQVRPYIAHLPTREELRRLLKGSAPPLRHLILVALYTGLREGAILRLTREDARERPGWLRCRDEKGSKVYWIPLAQPIAPLLAMLIDPPRRFPVRAWRRARKAVGLPMLRFHELRHVFSTTLAEAGVPHDVIRRLLGHGSRDVTDRYIQPGEGSLQAAVRALERAYGDLRGRTTKRTTRLKLPTRQTNCAGS